MRRHHVAAKTYQKLNKTVWKDIYYRFFLTATPFRNDEEEQLLFEAIAGAIIYKLDYHTAIRERYIVPVEAYYVELPKQKTEAYTWQEVYKELVVHNSVRNNMISCVLLALQNSHKSTLCLVKEVTHGKILSGYTGMPFVHGEDDESRKYIQEFNQGNLKTLISTTGIMGEGVDTRPCEYVILAGLGKAKSSIMQQIGRAVRNYPGKESAKIILIKDTSHKFCSRDFKAQCEIFRNEYACEPTRLDI